MKFYTAALCKVLDQCVIIDIIFSDLSLLYGLLVLV